MNHPYFVPFAAEQAAGENPELRAVIDKVIDPSVTPDEVHAIVTRHHHDQHVLNTVGLRPDIKAATIYVVVTHNPTTETALALAKNENADAISLWKLANLQSESVSDEAEEELLTAIALHPNADDRTVSRISRSRMELAATVARTVLRKRGLVHD